MLNTSKVMIMAFFKNWPWDSTFRSSKFLMLCILAQFYLSMFQVSSLDLKGFYGPDKIWMNRIFKKKSDLDIEGSR